MSGANKPPPVRRDRGLGWVLNVYLMGFLLVLLALSFGIVFGPSSAFRDSDMALLYMASCVGWYRFFRGIFP